MRYVNGCATGNTEILEVVGTAATVRVVLENWHGLSFTDFHSLLKIDGKWLIVSKIFHQLN